MTGSYNEQPFGDCDVFVPRLEGHDPAVPDVFANGKAQKAVQALFPDLLIAWRRLPESLGFVPSGWLWARLNVHKMAELSKGHKLAKVDSDPDTSMNIWLYRLGASLHRDGIRVIVHDANRAFRKVE